MNAIIYALPIILGKVNIEKAAVKGFNLFVIVNLVLREYHSVTVDRIVIGLCLLMYLLPAIYIVIVKLYINHYTNAVDDELLCVRSADSVRYMNSIVSM